MTYNDIYTKFLIEYDKDSVTSSYPSLTVYEIATLLDKAYLALIAQKFTGNNPRKMAFEADVKAVEDLQPLIKTAVVKSNSKLSKNLVYEAVFKLPGEGDQKPYLYFIDARYKWGNDHIYKRGYSDPVMLLSHEDAYRFVVSSVNLPWIKTPVCNIENDNITVYFDPFSIKNCVMGKEDYENYLPASGDLTVRYIKLPDKFLNADDSTNFDDKTSFELNDSMAEELIHLALVMALDTMESPRIQIKEQTRALES